MLEVEQDKEEDEEDEEECAPSVHFREGQWLGQWMEEEEDKQEEDSDTEMSASMISLAILNSSVLGLTSLVTVCYPVKTSFQPLHLICSGS